MMPYKKDAYDFDDNNDNDIEEDDLVYQENRTNDYLRNNVEFDITESGDQ